MSENNLTHYDLCFATAKRFIDKIALYEYKSFASIEEQPDVLVYGNRGTQLFEIKMSLSDFNADKYKVCRQKYTVPYWAYQIGYNKPTDGEIEKKKRMELTHGKIEIDLIEKRHLGNIRYFVCPAGVIPVEKVPEGWGLYWYKYASGDSTGILVNTYKGEKQ